MEFPAAVGAQVPAFNGLQTVRVLVQAKDTEYSLSIREGIVVLVPTDDDDQSQSWFKVDKFGEWMKDGSWLPGFSIVNKATGLAIKHPIAAHRPVQLVPYSPYHMDETVLWTGGSLDCAGYRAVRMINNIEMNLDAFLADGRRVKGGVLVGVWEWNDGGNQKWKFVAMN